MTQILQYLSVHWHVPQAAHMAAHSPTSQKLMLIFQLWREQFACKQWYTNIWHCDNLQSPCPGTPVHSVQCSVSAAFFFYSQTSNSDLLVNLSLKETEDNFLNSESICLRLSMLKSYGGKGKKRELHQLMLDFPLH